MKGCQSQDWNKLFEKTFVKFALTLGKKFTTFSDWSSVQHSIFCLIFRESDMFIDSSFQYTAKILLLNNLKT